MAEEIVSINNGLNNNLSLNDVFTHNNGICWSSTLISDKENEDKEVKNDKELLDLVRGYLVQCVDKILDEKPEEFVKEIIKERDEEIRGLRKEVELLKGEIERLKKTYPSTTTQQPFSPPWDYFLL